jgi:hypothetical protein
VSSTNSSIKFLEKGKLKKGIKQRVGQNIWNREKNTNYRYTGPNLIKLLGAYLGA